jgi:Domain of Unknown Function (DUF1543)
MSSAPQLFVVFLGGDPAPGRMGEDHEVVVVVADDVAAARKAARAKWTGTSKAHVDAVQVVSVIDGYRVALQKTDEADESSIDLTYVP